MRHTRAELAIVVVLLLGALHAGSARALTEDGKRRYRDGLRAFESGRYETAVTSLTAAIQDDSKEGVHKFRGTGVSFEDYLPHLYLGLALEKLSRFDEAVRSLDESIGQGAILARPELVRRLQAALAAARSEAGHAGRRDATPSTPGPTPSPTPERDASALAVATRTPAPLEALPRPPVEALAGVRPPPTRVAAVAAPPPAPARPSPGNTPGIREGVRLFFLSDFDGAASALEPLTGSSAKARMVLAYALASQYLTAPRRDPLLLERARREFDRATADGARADDRGYVSPAVRGLLARGAKGGG